MEHSLSFKTEYLTKSVRTKLQIINFIFLLMFFFTSLIVKNYWNFPLWNFSDPQEHVALLSVPNENEIFEQNHLDSEKSDFIHNFSLNIEVKLNRSFFWIFWAKMTV